MDIREHRRVKFHTERRAEMFVQVLCEDNTGHSSGVKIAYRNWAGSNGQT